MSGSSSRAGLEALRNATILSQPGTVSVQVARTNGWWVLVGERKEEPHGAE